MKKIHQNKNIHIPYYIDNSKFEYYEQRWKITSINLLNMIYPKIDDRENIKIMDFGCGRGEMLKLLSENNYRCFGMDFDDKCIKLSSRYAPCKKGIYKNLLKIYEKEFFDVIICLHVLEHMLNPKECVKLLSKASKKYLLVGVPNLAKLSNLKFKKIGKCNEGHVCGWDFPHFANFLINICKLKVIHWGFDLFRLPNFNKKIDKALHLSGLREFLEERFLIKLFPFMSNSIIALCEK